MNYRKPRSIWHKSRTPNNMVVTRTLKKWPRFHRLNNTRARRISEIKLSHLAIDATGPTEIEQVILKLYPFLNDKKTNNPNKKMSKGFEPAFLKKICTWLISTWKDAQLHESLGNANQTYEIPLHTHNDGYNWKDNNKYWWRREEPGPS